MQGWRRLVRGWRRKADPQLVYSQSAEEMRIWQARARLFMIVLTVVTLTACMTPGAQPASPMAIVAPAVAAPALLAEPTLIPAEVLATLDTAAQLELVELPRRDPVQLTERLNPAIGAVPLLAEPKHYAVGDRASFWVHNSDAKRNIEIEAELIYQTEVANVWVEAAHSFDAERIKRSIDRFSRVAYPALVRTFGSEANPGIDGDPRLHVLHTAQMGAGVAGYFYSADKYTTAVNPFSNEKEIFFINLNWLNRLGDYTVYETVLAHEFQHMIHWSQDRGEDLWLNEGLSEYAQEVAQYDPDLGFAVAFLAEPDLSLTTWSADPNANAPHYGASYLFVAYLAQRFGDEFLSQLVAEQSNGAVGVAHALAAVGADVTFDNLFADWVVANWVDDPGVLDAGGRYGYRRIDLSDARAAATIVSYPVVETAAEVSNYGTDYLVLDGEGSFVFDFQGAVQTRLADLPPGGDGRRWWSNRGDDANPRLTRQFDLSGLTAGAPVTMTVDAWWNIEETYDYGYVMASRDGEEWTILPGQHTRTDNPTGNALGAGYTGVSGDGDTPGWVQEVYDLSAFAGGPLWVQFSYVTDDAVNTEGWFVDNVAIPALGYADDFAGDAAGWTSEGWVLTDNQLPQRWLLQWMTFDRGRLIDVTRVPVGADGSAQIDVGELGGQRNAVLAISALTPVTTEPAAYKYWIEDKN
ncbi:MAG: hypothetical protein WAU00_22950 [Caldilinea sp.]